MEDFINFIAGVMEVDPKKLNENTSYGSIEKWDSLMHMRMVMEIEEEYDVEIPIDEIPSIKTLKDFYKYIERR
ncbi:MAG: acyl carrier protein [Bacteroidota bacterium]|nr:acyl carrier protein [Bacteroidota bacterium]